MWCFLALPSFLALQDPLGSPYIFPVQSSSVISPWSAGDLLLSSVGQDQGSLQSRAVCPQHGGFLLLTTVPKVFLLWLLGTQTTALQDLRGCSAYSFLVVLSSATGVFLQWWAEDWGILADLWAGFLGSAALSDSPCEFQLPGSLRSPMLSPQLRDSWALLGPDPVPWPGNFSRPRWAGDSPYEQYDSPHCSPLRDYHPVLSMFDVWTPVLYTLFRFLVV